MADINQLHSILFAAYTEAKAEFVRDNPKLPKPILSFTYRSPQVQDAFYAQGRQPREVVNEMRRKLNLYLLGPKEAANRVTNARGGQSPHNYLPAMAFDGAFQRPNGTLDWSEPLFRKFALYVLKHPGITWGGHFKSLVDLPHFEVTGWASKVKRIS